MSGHGRMAACILRAVCVGGWETGGLCGRMGDGRAMWEVGWEDGRREGYVGSWLARRHGLIVPDRGVRPSMEGGREGEREEGREGRREEALQSSMGEDLVLA